MLPATDSFADRIVETIHEPLLVLGENFFVSRASPSFCRTFRVAEEDVVDHSLFEPGEGEWAVSELRAALDRVIGEDESFEGLEIDRRFPGLGRKVMRLNGRTLALEELREWMESRNSHRTSSR